MKYRLGIFAVVVLVSACNSGPEPGANDVAYVDDTETAALTATNAAPPSKSELIFCKQVQRRTTQDDCDDLDRTASDANAGTAAFNVPDMVRGQPTLIQLAISLQPPPDDMAGNADTAGNTAISATPGPTSPASPSPSPSSTDEPTLGVSLSPEDTPAPSPSASVRIARHAGAAPRAVVENLPGRTEEYHPLVGRDMRAELVGEGFRIVAKSNPSQVLSPGSTTSWEWEVTPLPGANYVLTVKTAVEGVMANGEHVVLGSTVETRRVAVQVLWYDRVKDGLSAAPTWIKLITGVLVALGVMFGAWWTMIRSARGKAGSRAAPTDEDKS